MNKFITPVSMQVTQEQYEKDLKESLAKLGYDTKFDTKNVRSKFFDGYVLVNNADNHLGDVLLCSIDRKESFNRYFINHYNPELFLALAAMTEGDKPIIGEYVIAAIGETKYLIKFDKISSDTNIILGTRYKCLEDDMNLWQTRGGFHKIIRKATKEELIEHLVVKEEEFVLPEKWCVKGDKQEVIDYSNIHGKIKPYKLNKNYYHHYPSCGEGCTTSDKIEKGYTEITFEQFKKYVLKEEEWIPKVGEWVFITEEYKNQDNFCGEGNTLKSNGPFCVQNTNNICVSKMSDLKVMLSFSRFRKAEPHEINSFKENNLNQEKMIEKLRNINFSKTNRFPFSLKPIDAQIIIEYACSSWSKRLADKWAVQIVLNHNIEISEAFYKEMRSACTKEQHELFDKIFGKDIEECIFKNGEYIVYDNKCYCVINTKSLENCVELRAISFKYGVSKRFPSVEDINKNARLWTVNDLKDGEPAWVRPYVNSAFELCYSNGKGNFYAGQIKSGNVLPFNHVLPFDPYNLPVNK